jgi:hypothetical protein
MMILALLTLTRLLANSAPSPAPSLAPAGYDCNQASTFTGTVCAPTDGKKHAAVLMLGGSDGGDSMAREAALLAKDGFVSASVAYFGAPGLPQSLDEVPVETVGTALAEISKRSDVDPQRIALFGVSKGGELALLAASIYPQIHAVVAAVPSPFAWQGIPNGRQSAVASSWTVAGKPVPFVPYGPEMAAIFSAAYSQQTPIDMAPGYVAAMKDTAAVNRAFFHLENIQGPILFLGAGDDRIWDSTAQSQLALAYLKAHNHRYAEEYLSYPGAGHLFLFATPAFPLVEAPFGGGLTIQFGGTAKANVAAGVDATAKVHAFLEKAY